jgi:UDP-N-acetylmuramoylalanine--D-glutamate ligase
VSPEDVKGKRFSVLGGARSGLAVARLLAKRGAQVFVSDAAPPAKMEKAKRELEALGIPAEFGEHSARVLDADMIVLSPGVPSAAPVVREALTRGRTVVSEVEVASWFCPAPVVAVTGTNGKTTTITLLGRIFADAKRPSIVGGNIGTAFSQITEELTADGTAILEISSFQLDHILSFRPRVSVILNITPDHLDRYSHSLEKYIASKCRIFENQRAGDTLIYNNDDRVTQTAVRERVNGAVTLLPFSLEREVPEGGFLRHKRMMVARGGNEVEVAKVEEISIRGPHNLQNAMAAALVARVMGIPTASVRATLRNFKGVEHRLEFVRELHGITYVNDSKATNVDSVWYAVQSFRQPLVLFLGGRDKGNDYRRLEELVRKRVRAIIAVGESAGKVEQAFARVVPVTVCGTMDEAVRTSQRVAQRGDVVLLSPACASFDWFENYEHRGRVFKELVAQLV